MEENEIRSMLVDIVENGDFPNGTFDIRHIKRIYTFDFISEHKVQFWVERHPHVFGAPTLGVASSAFITKNYLYELNTATKTVELIKKTEEDPVVDISMLAYESASDLIFEDGGYDEHFERLKTKDEVVEFAINDFNSNEYWRADAEIKASELPTIKDFEEKYLDELKKSFVYKFLQHWEFYQDYKKEHEEE